MSAALLTFSFFATKAMGLDRTVGLLRTLGRTRRRLRLQGRQRAPAEIGQRVQRGLALLPFQIECLDQAIAVWYALNLKGHAATLNIGMKLSPMCAHAWVVCGDEVFVSLPGLEDFTVVARFAGWDAEAGHRST